MQNLFKVFLVVFISFMAFDGVAQSSDKKTVVLINGVPNEVLLSSVGDILETFREMPGYLPFSGSQTLKEILDKNPKYKIPDNKYKKEVLIAEVTEPTVVKKEVPVVTETIVVEEKSTSNVRNIADENPTLISVASSSDDLGVRVIYFDSKNAALSDETAFKLNEIANILERDKDITLKILYLVPPNKSQSELSTKRANAIKKYLELKDVDPKQIEMTASEGGFQNSIDLFLNKGN